MDSGALAEHLLLLEQQLLERSIKGFTDLLEDDFVEFGSSGRIWDKQKALAGIADGARLEATIMDFTTRQLAPDLILVTYRLSKNDDMNLSLRSSIWRQNQGKWRMIFHQGTPVQA